MNSSLNILLIEDSEDDSALISLALRREGIRFVIKRVDNREEFSEAIDQFKPDVILSDHALPQFNSLEALKLYHEKKLNIPFILVTGTVPEEFAISVIKQGIDDYILKNNLSSLPSSMLKAIGRRNAEKEKVETIESHNPK